MLPVRCENLTIFQTEWFDFYNHIFINMFFFLVNFMEI